MDKKEIGWLIFVTIIVGFVVGNVVLLPIAHYLLGFEATLTLSFLCSDLAAGAYLMYGAYKRGI